MNWCVEQISICRSSRMKQDSRHSLYQSHESLLRAQEKYLIREQGERNLTESPQGTSIYKLYVQHALYIYTLYFISLYIMIYIITSHLMCYRFIQYDTYYFMLHSIIYHVDILPYNTVWLNMHEQHVKVHDLFKNLATKKKS